MSKLLAPILFALTCFTGACVSNSSYSDPQAPLTIGQRGVLQFWDAFSDEPLQVGTGTDQEIGVEQLGGDEIQGVWNVKSLDGSILSIESAPCQPTTPVANPCSNSFDVHGVAPGATYVEVFDENDHEIDRVVISVQ